MLKIKEEHKDVSNLCIIAFLSEERAYYYLNWFRAVYIIHN